MTSGTLSIPASTTPAGTIWPVSNSVSNSIGIHDTFSGDININGVSLNNLLEDISKRLLILSPDPSKLKKYEALKRAYDDYKILENLLYDD